MQCDINIIITYLILIVNEKRFEKQNSGTLLRAGAELSVDDALSVSDAESGGKGA